MLSRRRPHISHYTIKLQAFPAKAPERKWRDIFRKSPERWCRSFLKLASGENRRMHLYGHLYAESQRMQVCPYGYLWWSSKYSPWLPTFNPIIFFFMKIHRSISNSWNTDNPAPQWSIWSLVWTRSRRLAVRFSIQWIQSVFSCHKLKTISNSVKPVWHQGVSISSTLAGIR